MTELTRRSFVFGALALPFCVQSAYAGQWVEVTGTAIIHNGADIDAARRRALADALLSASFVGGAAVQGHSVMTMAKMTSDLLIVRPTGRVLTYELVTQQQEGHYWNVRIRAQVGDADLFHCKDRRTLVLVVYPPEIRVSAQAPAWAEALAHQLGNELLELTRSSPDVAEVAFVQGLPVGPDPARDSTNWRALTRGAMRAPAGGHSLHMQLQIAPSGARLNLNLGLRLVGPAQEQLVETHVAQIRLPGPSMLGRTAPLAQPDRNRLAHELSKGAVPAMQSLFTKAGCQPIRALIALDGEKLSVPAGRAHGLTRASLAFTIDRDHSVEMLEVEHLSDRVATLSPLDPTRQFGSFAGRPVRFIDTGRGIK